MFRIFETWLQGIKHRHKTPAQRKAEEEAAAHRIQKEVAAQYNNMAVSSPKF
jgi:hypothetical protein